MMIYSKLTPYISALAMTMLAACSSTEYAAKNSERLWNNVVNSHDEANDEHNRLAVQPSQASPALFLGNRTWHKAAKPLSQIEPVQGQVLVANPAPGNDNPFVPVHTPYGRQNTANINPFGNLTGYNDRVLSPNTAFTNQPRGPAARALQSRILQGSQYGVAGPVPGSSFNAVLKTEYALLAQHFLDSYRDALDARYFNNKSLHAKQGRSVFPEDPDLWDLTRKNRREIWRARYSLEQTLEFGARDLAPEYAAKAQVAYDCWVAEAEENSQNILQLPCGQKFIQAFKHLRRVTVERRSPELLPANLYPQYSYNEDVIRPAAPPISTGYVPSYQSIDTKIVYDEPSPYQTPTQALTPAPALRAPVVTEPEVPIGNDATYDVSANVEKNPPTISEDIIDPDTTQGAIKNINYDVYFDYNDYMLSEDGKDILDDVIGYINAINVIEIVISGYADTSGTFEFNLDLSEKRIQAVQDYLIESDIDPSFIQVFAFGETNLPVPTPDNVREPRNRVVQIVVR